MLDALLLILLIICFLLWPLYRMLLLKIAEHTHLDYASGLADTYFYGYLSIVLPNLGTEEQIGIPKRLEIFKRKQELPNKAVPCNKLIILVPSSGFTSPLISGHPQSFNRIKYEGQLICAPEITRNGIKNRRYQTALYSIVDINGANKIWVAMEYVPILAILNEACRDNSKKCKILKRFTTLLQEKVEMDQKVRGTCEIFYWDDSVEDFNLSDELMRFCSSSIRIKIPNSIFSPTLIDLFKNKAFKLYHDKNQGYANALVDNYFYGYLKVVLPNKGTTEEIGIVRRLQNLRTEEFEEHLAYNAVPYNKLIVPVPSSGFSSHDITECEYSSKRIQYGGYLRDAPEISRSGIKGKTYKTPVYRVIDKEGNAAWVVMEFSPSLTTLIEGSRDNPYLNQYKREIVVLFVTILKEKLDTHEDVKNKCEIIYCNESDINFSLPDEIFRRIRSYDAT